MKLFQVMQIGKELSIFHTIFQIFIEMGCCGSDNYVISNNPDGLSPNNARFLKEESNQGFTFDHPIFQGELAIGTKYACQKKYPQAAGIFRTYLENHPEATVVVIDGLGQDMYSQGYYKKFWFSWYRKEIQAGNCKGSVYDALALCYEAMVYDEQIYREEIEKGMKWYQTKVDQFPQNIGYLMGYAHFLNNKSIYEEALDYYNAVIDIKPSWTRPLECMNFIHEYQRVDKKKSAQIANKLLSLEPNNRVALFLLSRHEKADQKLQKLKRVAELYPNFPRALNETGLVYRKQKSEFQNAIPWHQRVIDIYPEFQAAYFNIGINYHLLKDYEKAIEWCMKAIKLDNQYSGCYQRLTDIFEEVKYTDEDIQKLREKYEISHFYYYYQMGMAYDDHKQNNNSAEKWYLKAEKYVDECNISHKLYNSMAINKKRQKKYDEAEKYYRKSMQIKPNWEHAPYNLAIMLLDQGERDQAIEAYRKAIEASPRYSYAYNNLGTIYKKQRNWDEAIKCFKKAVEHLSTYTLALANLGICYLKIENYREAFNAMERAKQCLEHDNNDLSSGNKAFLKTTLQQFDKEGEAWRQNGCVTSEQKAKLKAMMNNFESKFNRMYSNDEKQPVHIDKVMKKEILEIVRLIQEDKFELLNIDRVYDLVKSLFADNEEYFHIVPQLFTQYFVVQAFQKKRSILDIQKELFIIAKRLSAKTVETIQQNQMNEEKETKDRLGTVKMKHFVPLMEKQIKVNLFKAEFFNSYEEIYGEIMHANQAASKSYPQFKLLVDYARKHSYGTLYGLGMKVPKDEQQQFKVILRIFEKMFKNQLTSERVRDIIGKIDLNLRARLEQHGAQYIGVADVIHEIMETWTKQITMIVIDRKEKKAKTECFVSDLLRAKVMYDSVDHIRKAMIALDELCNAKTYRILEIDNRLAKQQTQDVVFKIQIKQAVCELQLAMKQDEAQYHFTHSIYEIERSPLGCIFGSYIFLSKGFNYPLFTNCQDIVKNLDKNLNHQEQKTLEAAKYVVECLSSGSPKVE